MMLCRKFSRLTGPLLSILLHVVIILLLVFFVGQFIEPVEKEKEEFVLRPVDPEVFKTNPGTDIDEPDIERPNSPSPAPSIPIKPPAFDVPDPEPIVTKNEVSKREGRPEVGPKLPAFKPHGTPSTKARFDKDGKLAIHAKKHAKVTKRSVNLALKWLHDNQRDDGGWDSNGKDNELAVTGLATLAFLANGYTPDNDRYGQTVESALQFLVSKQNKNGLWGREYSHAICTYAVAEGFAMTRVVQLRDALYAAIPHIVGGMNIRKIARSGTIQPIAGLDQPKDRQVTAGLWDYKYQTDTDRFDTSVSGWQVQALKAAKLAGSQDPMIHRALEMAANGLKHLQSEKTGKIGYTSPGSGSEWMTGVGALSLMMTGDMETPEVQRALAHLAPASCTFGLAKPNSFYGWYYLTQVKFNQQGDAWASWREQFVREYIRNQERDGSWISPSKGEGHGNENQFGRAYTTSLGVLTMSVFYRSELLTNDAQAAARPKTRAIEPDIMIHL